MQHKLRIRFEKRLYGTDDGDFSIFAASLVDREDLRKIKTNKAYKNFSVSGEFALSESELGNIFTVTIEEDIGSRYPNSYKLIKLHYELPTNAEDQWKYLEMGSIVPLMSFLSIEDHFKKTDKILDIIMDNPERLTKVKGIGKKTAMKYQERLLEDRDKAAIFAEYGHIDGIGDKIIKYLVNWKPSVAETIKTIKKDPFSLLENENIGFMTADKIRDFYGIPLNDRNRILHGVSYFLQELLQDSGDTYEDIFIAAKMIARKLFVSYEEVITLLAEIKSDEKQLNKYKLKIFGKNITTQSLFNAELLVYKKTKMLMEDKQRIAPEKEWDKIKENVLSTTPSELSEEQEAFLHTINTERVTVLLGPGGSGKSWIINLACQMIKQAGKTYGLFAPTARAAHVMSDYVGTEALTIHRGLMSFGEEEVKTEYDVLIVDEYSMVDSELAAVILRAMGENTRLIIVGDDFQLQSVGPGNMLFDIVEFIKVPTIKLTKVFRQNENSKILDYSNALREGTFRLPNEQKVENEDIVFINESDDEAQKDIALKLYKKIYDKYGVNDIMLLSPTNKGVSGRNVLNKKVQELVNGSKSPKDIVFGAMLDEDQQSYFKNNDYITVKNNNYKIENDYGETTQIINGDLGRVTYTNSNKLTFKIGHNPYTIDKSEIKEMIDHAWTITIHKSQGGQASEVIIVLPKNSYFMLNANMLYTAITRAKVKCYVIGDFKGINSAAMRQANYSRKTMIQLQALGERKDGQNGE